HPPPFPGTPALEDSYRTLVDTLPARQRPAARQLPWRLGLTATPDGGWGDFVGLHPNRHLPVYAAQAPGGALSLGRAGFARHLYAHHVGGFMWLRRDRMEDGQVAVDQTLIALADTFDRRWREALVDATGDGALAALLCRRAGARWRRGTMA